MFFSPLEYNGECKKKSLFFDLTTSKVGGKNIRFGCQKERSVVYVGFNFEQATLREIKQFSFDRFIEQNVKSRMKT